MTVKRWVGLLIFLAGMGWAPRWAKAADTAAGPVGVVSHVKVLSDKVRDVSSMEAWRRSFLRDGMSDAEKAEAVWRSVVMFRYQDAPPIEFLHEGCVHDPIKTFNVYGYGMCCCASSNIEALARYAGLQARGWAINGHSVPEVYYGGGWHLYDASLVNYFPLPDGTVASLAEIVTAVKGWLEKHPECRGNDAKLHQFQQAGGWLGWKQGPPLLTACPFFDWGGWWPAKTHGWCSTMQEYSGAHGTPFPYEYGYSQGYEVNIELRPGERLTRNWFNKGLHVNGILKDGDAPGCLNGKVGDESMAYLAGYGDITAGRVGSGTLEYDVPLAEGTFRGGSLKVENLSARSEDGRGPAVHVRAADRPGLLEFRMLNSYVYLGGTLTADAVVGEGGKIELAFSDNNGLDWKPVALIEQSGRQEIDLGKLVLRHYDYRLKFVFRGGGTGLDSLRIVHAIQCSQRALPTLARGQNTISFLAGPQEGTITIEVRSDAGGDPGKAKNVTLANFHPVLKGIAPQYLQVAGTPAEATFAIATPGDMTRLRLGGHFRARDKADQWDVQVSLDGGKTFRGVDHYAGPTQGKCQFTTLADIPAGTRQALLRWSGRQRNTTCLFSLRIDADYKQPGGGFRPVKVTYLWEEEGTPHRDVHIARSPAETYHVVCQSKPTMKSIVLELAE
jgi:hypothetical protein